eukprot:scaffold114094_cov57-Phaeocystis_antarctica.AAC.3
MAGQPTRGPRRAPCPPRRRGRCRGGCANDVGGPADSSDVRVAFPLRASAIAMPHSGPSSLPPRLRTRRRGRVKVASVASVHAHRVGLAART